VALVSVFVIVDFSFYKAHFVKMKKLISQGFSVDIRTSPSSYGKIARVSTAEHHHRRAGHPPLVRNSSGS
jgi:hypothetical protein